MLILFSLGTKPLRVVAILGARLVQAVVLSRLWTFFVKYFMNTAEP